jgi:hypothetical protein
MVAETAPLPIFGTITQTALHRIAMNIPKLFYKLPVVPNVEIIVALLPEVSGPIDQSPRHALLQRLERIGQRSFLGFADQQVDVFRHDNVAIDPQLETPSDALKRNFKCMLCQRIGERLSATVAAECYKMALPRLLESFQSPRHKTSLGRESAPLKPKSGLNGPPA